MQETKPTYQDLERKIQDLENEVARLKSKNANLDGNTVTVPAKFEPIFNTAQDHVKEYFKNLQFHPDKGTIEVNDERYVLVRASALSLEFFNQILELYADKGEDQAFRIGRNFLFDIGHVLGKEDAKRFHKKMNLKDPIEKLSAGPVHFAYAGWAYVDILPESRPSPDDDFYLKYHHPYSFEADSWMKEGMKAKQPVCIMNAAYSSGWCEESYGIPLTAVEIKCKAKGDDNCTFIMAPSHRISEYLDSEQDTAIDSEPFEIPKFFERKEMVDQLRDNLNEKEVLLKEIHHRVKNNLQIISSLLNLQFTSVTDEKVIDLIQESKNRVKTMALVHEKLYGTRDLSRVGLKDYLNSILELHISVGKSIDLNYDDHGIDDQLQLSIDNAILIGLIVNEMFSNAMKYAFEKTTHPKISVTTQTLENQIVLTVADNGRGIENAILFPNEDSLGFELIHTLIEQISGTIDLDRSNGTTFTMHFDKNIFA